MVSMQDYLQSIADFIDSEAFVGLVALVALTYTLYEYRDKRKAAKRDAANILLLEIQRAQRKLKEAIEQAQKARDNENVMLAEDRFLMPTNSWSKYQYLFVRDLDRDLWDDLSSFYERCALFDEAVRYNNSAFQKNEEQLRANTLRITFDRVNVLLDKAGKVTDAAEGAFDTAVQASEHVKELVVSKSPSITYAPRKPLLDAKDQLELLQTYDIASVVSRFKRLAK